MCVEYFDEHMPWDNRTEHDISTAKMYSVTDPAHLTNQCKSKNTLTEMLYPRHWQRQTRFYTSLKERIKPNMHRRTINDFINKTLIN